MPKLPANDPKPIIYRPAKAGQQDGAYPPSIRSALAILQPLGLPRWCQRTPLHHFLWQRGVMLSPPILAGFVGNFMGYGFCFALLAALVLWLLSGGSLLAIMGGAFSAAMIGGLIVACRLREWREAHNLPSWQEIWQSPKE